MGHRLERLLRPKSVAVVGGGAWGESVLRGLRRIGFEGSISLVDPGVEEIHGVLALRDVQAFSVPPDAVFIGVNREATVPIVARLSKMGAGGAVCFASGFADSADGRILNAKLLEAAGDMPILGPDCYGFINALDGAALWPDIHGLLPVHRGAALVMQSSNLALNLTMQPRGLPIAYIGTVGNQAQIGFAELAEAMLEDDRVSVVGLHVEAIGDLRAFEVMAGKAQLMGKAIVILRTGRSQGAQKAPVSHALSPTGSTEGASALFARLGCAEVGSLEALAETLKILHAIGPLPANRIAALSCCTGQAALIADAAEAHGLCFADLTDRQREWLGRDLGPEVPLTNPLDYDNSIQADRDRMARVCAEMMSGGAVLTLLVADFPPGDRPETGEWDSLVAAATKAHNRVGMPLAILSILPENMPEPMARHLMGAGLIPLCGIDAALAAVAAAIVLGRPLPHRPPVLMARIEGTPERVDPHVATVALSAHGLDMPERAVVADATEAADWALGRGPVVLKSLGPAQKSGAGGVKSDLRGTEAILNAADTLGPGRLLVEDMVSDPVAELVVRILADPAHGYVLTLGAGDARAKFIRDTCHLLLPVRASDVESALEGLRRAAVLHGCQGRRAVDLQAVVAAVMAVQAYVLAQAGRVAEVEINPLIVTEGRAIAGDALIRQVPLARKPDT